MMIVTRNYMFKLLLLFINFCDVRYRDIQQRSEAFVNRNLDNYVIYYALYSVEDKHCAILYDYRSFWKRMYLVIYRYYLLVFYSKDLEDACLIFKYTSVVNNVENLSAFFVNCAVVTHVKEHELQYDFFVNESDTDNSITPNFVYAVVNDGENDHDFTNAFNLYSNGIMNSKSMTCLDIITVLCKVYSKHIDLRNFTLRCMTNITFEEIILKENDSISTKLVS